MSVAIAKPTLGSASAASCAVRKAAIGAVVSHGSSSTKPKKASGLEKYVRHDEIIAGCAQT